MPLVKKEGHQQSSIDRSPTSYPLEYLAIKAADYPKTATSSATSATAASSALSAPNSNTTGIDLAMYSQHTSTTVDGGLNPSPLQMQNANTNQPPPLGSHYGMDASYPLENAFKDYKALALQQHHAAMNPVLNAMNNPLLMRPPTNQLSQDMMKAIAPSTAGTQYHQPPLPAPPLPPPPIDERWGYYQQNPEREAKWAEVKRYVDSIRRHVDEGSAIDLSREKFIDLYNLTVTLLRAVDNLDPDKSGRKSEAAINALIQPNPTQAELDFLSQSRKASFDYFRRNSYEANAYYGSPVRYPGDISTLPYYPNLPPSYSMPQFHTPAPMPVIPPVPPPFVAPQRPPETKKNGSNEVFFDEQQDADQKPKRQRRKRTLYSSRRNLQCNMCGVTQTPEWRRGPDGDHTLCNACGLHYAKALKRERKAREGRKHSIDLLLNVPNEKTSSNGSIGSIAEEQSSPDSRTSGEFQSNSSSVSQHSTNPPQEPPNPPFE